jgi:hypothetical protein
MVDEKQTAVSPIASPIFRPPSYRGQFCVLGFWGTAVFRHPLQKSEKQFRGKVNGRIQSDKMHEERL